MATSNDDRSSSAVLKSFLSKIWAQINTMFAVTKTLSNTDLNTVKTVGFYNAGGSHGCTNVPGSLHHFGMEVIHDALGEHYTQKVYGDSIQYTRRCVYGTWGAWAEDKLTDTTYSSKTAASGGTDVSLVTTDEKYTWNNKQGALSTAQLNAVNSGITSSKVSTYDGYATTLNAKADKGNVTGATKCKVTYNSQGIITAGANLMASDVAEAGTLTNDTSGNAATATGYTSSGGIATALAGKQATLTQGTNIQISGTTISATDTTYSETTSAVITEIVNGLDL